MIQRLVVEYYQIPRFILSKYMKPKNNSFIVLMDKEGVYRPLVFISRLNDAGEISARNYLKNIADGEKLMVVNFDNDNESCEY